MQNPLLVLNECVGLYIGHGINHEGQKFEGTLEIKKLLSGLGVQIQFTATSWENPKVVYHDEVSVIAPNSMGGLSLFNLNSNTPFLAEHVYVPSAVVGDKSFVFRHGDITDSNSFREEVKLEIPEANMMGYHYSWGLPGGEFTYRSGLEMTLVQGKSQQIEI